MSFAGPHGEAACRVCKTLQDLGPDRKLIRHPAGPLRNVCKGSYTYAHTQIRELEDLQFSAEEQYHHCPVCERDIEIRTVGLSPAQYRLNSHYREHEKPHTGFCEGTGRILSELDEVARQVREVQARMSGPKWMDPRGWLS